MSAPSQRSLIDALAPTDGMCVSIIGAGGKTTTMLALAKASRACRKTAIVSTTTRIWPPDGIELVLHREGSESIAARMRLALSRSEIVCLGERVGDRGKLEGVPAHVLCALKEAHICSIFLVEADGASGRPLKAHGPHEPVVPACTDILLVVAGLDAVGLPLSEETVHRIDPMIGITQCAIGDPITVDVVALALRAAGKHRPEGARLCYVLNKADDTARIATANRIVEALAQRGDVTAVFVAAQGTLVSSMRPTQAAAT